MGQFSKKPSFYNLEESTIFQGEKASLYLDITKKNIIQDIGYEWNGEEDVARGLEYLCQQVKGESLDTWSKNIDEGLDHVLVGLGYSLLKKAMTNYQGQPPAWIETLDHRDHLLVCRCFGVSQKHIDDILKKEPTTCLFDITNQTKAGAACGSCENDIQTMIEEFRINQASFLFENNEIRNRKRIRPLGLSPSEFFLQKLSPLIEREQWSLNILSFDGNVLWLSQKKDFSLSSQMEERIEKELGVLIRVRFF